MPVYPRTPARRATISPLGSSTVQKSVLLAAIQKEIQRHDLSYVVDEPPSVALGGKGVVVSACPACKKRINTTGQFLDHLANEVMPEWVGDDESKLKHGFTSWLDRRTSELRPKSAKLRPRISFHVSQFLILNCPLRRVRAGPPNRRTPPRRAESKTSGTALSSVGRVAGTPWKSSHP